MRRIVLAVLVWLATAISSWAQSPTVTYMSGLSNASAMSGANQFVLCQQNSCGSGQTLVNGTLSQVLTYIEGQLGTAAQVNTGTSGATLGLLNGNLTFSGNDVFSGNLTFSGLTTGTQVGCLGLTSGNAVVASNAACGSGGGSISVSGGGNTTTGVTTVAFGNGFVATPNGSNTTSTVNQNVTDNTKTTNYTVAAGDMANALNLGGSTATLTLPAESSTIFAPGMSLSLVSTASGNWTVTNSTGLSTNLISPVVKGTNGTLIANANGTSLDFFGLQTATSTALGGFFSNSCTGGEFLSSLNTDGTSTCGTPAGGGNVSTSGSITTNGVTYWAGSTLAASTAAMTNGQLLVGQTSAAPAPETVSGSCTLNASGVMSCVHSATIGWVAGVNPNNALAVVLPANSTLTSIVGNVETATGSAATVSVNVAASGTACSAGTTVHSGSFNANGTAATNQTLTLTTTAVSSGNRLCLQTTGTTAWTGGSGIGGLTVTYTTP